MITVSIKAGSRYPVDRKGIREIIKSTLGDHGIEDEVEIEVSFVGDRRMASLNKSYMGKVGTTDVLSFPLTEASKAVPESMEFVGPPDSILRLGSIIISYPQARKQAQENNVVVDEEVNRLVQHGLLHLLGIHHD